MIKGKCPKCNSAKILESKDVLKCQKCGYEHRTEIPENIPEIKHEIKKI